MTRYLPNVWGAGSLVLLLGICVAAQTSLAGNLLLEVDQLRNDKGQLLVLVFDNRADYSAALADEGRHHTFVAIRAHTSHIRLAFPDFPPGTYAAITIHDENTNDDLDTNLWGVPKEGFGFSNTGETPEEPTFAEAAFVHRKGNDSAQRLSLRYYD